MAATTTARSGTSSIVSWEKAQQQLKTNTKKNNPLLAVAIGAVVLLAIAGLWRALHQQAPGDWIEVVITRRDTPAGVRIPLMGTSFLKVPKKYATQDMITSLNVAAGSVARTYIPAGEPLRKFMLFPDHRELAANLETQERAITLQLDDDAMVVHSIRPEDKVDILAVCSNQGKKYTKTICQNVHVLTAAPKEQALARGGTNTSVNKITLAVAPDQAELITEALDAGKIRLVLRSPLSNIEQHLPGAAPDDLLPADALAAPTAPPEVKLSTNATLIPPPPVNLPPPEQTNPALWMVEVIMGNHKESYGVPSQ